VLHFNKVPIVLDKNHEIVAGHTRLKAAIELGMETVPCLIADDLSDAQIKAFRLVDNKAAELAEWNLELLSLELEELSHLDLDFSMEDFGFEFEGGATENAKGEIKEDDFDADLAVAEIETPISKRGDIWLLGKHRLMCGDSTSLEDVSVLMDGQKARQVFTDPPWNVDYGGSAHPSWKPDRQIMNDSMSTADFKDFMLNIFTTMSKKWVKNSGQAAQYYVEDSHPAIISKEEFAVVQAEFERRTNMRGYSKTGKSKFTSYEQAHRQ
jgi:hypothetical protein